MQNNTINNNNYINQQNNTINNNYYINQSGEERVSLAEKREREEENFFHESKRIFICC